MSSNYLCVKEVARRWRVSSMTVYRLVDEGRLRATRVGRSLRITEADFERYLAENQTGPVPHQPKAGAR